MNTYIPMSINTCSIRPSNGLSQSNLTYDNHIRLRVLTYVDTYACYKHTSFQYREDAEHRAEETLD
jgi:hypothetical protein